MKIIFMFRIIQEIHFLGHDRMAAILEAILDPVDLGVDLGLSLIRWPLVDHLAGPLFNPALVILRDLSEDQDINNRRKSLNR